MNGQNKLPAFSDHGATRPPAVELDSYNVELQPDEGALHLSPLWRHGDQEDVGRDGAVETLAEMIKGLIAAARKEMRLAPFIGIGCPGIVNADGSIKRGAQNRPGNWESSQFNLPASLHALIPAIGGEETTIVMHNDAVVQGLSEVPFQKDVAHWGALTIGTGLGNARFTNRQSAAVD